MSEAQSRRKQWLAHYYRLSSREQRLILIMVLLLVFCGSYYGVWIPLQKGFESARNDYLQQWELLQWVQANGGGTPGAGNASFSEWLTQTAKEQQLSFTRMETGADKTVKLTLEEVSFNRLIHWLDQVQRDRHVTIVTADIVKRGSGVNVTLQIKD